VPALGAPGSALATSLSLLLQLAIILCAVSRVSAVQSDVSRRPNFDEIRIAVRVGTPIAIHRCTDVGVLLVAGIVGGRIGSVDLAAHQIAMTLVNIIYTIAIGLAGAGAVRVAYAVGARDEKRLGLAGRVAFFSTLAIMLILALPVLTLRTHIASLFTDRPSIIEACGPLIAWASLYLVVQGLKVVGVAVIRGVGNTRAILLPALVGQYGVGLPIAIALALVIGDGMPGLWAGLTLGSSCTAIALVVVFRRLIVGSIVPLEDRAQP
jgi:MATE family multidrug resistance protein